MTIIVDKSIAGIIELANRIKTTAKNQDDCKGIFSDAEQLANVAIKMQSTGITESLYVDTFLQSLEEVQSCCESLEGADIVKKIAYANKHKEILRDLNSTVRKAVNLIQLELLQVLITQNKELKRDVLELL